VHHTYRHASKAYAAVLPSNRVAAVQWDPRVSFVAADREVRADELPTGIDRNAARLSGTRQASAAVAGTAALCIARRACPGTPAQIIQELRADAAAFNQANPCHGFQGDPRHPLSGKYYGYLIRAGLH
jgi:hypothetical protein